MKREGQPVAMFVVCVEMCEGVGARGLGSERGLVIGRVWQLGGRSHPGHQCFVAWGGRIGRGGRVLGRGWVVGMAAGGMQVGRVSSWDGGVGGSRILRVWPRGVIGSCFAGLGKGVLWIVAWSGGGWLRNLTDRENHLCFVQRREEGCFWVRENGEGLRCVNVGRRLVLIGGQRA